MEKIKKVNSKNGKEKYFTKFNNSIHKERILAKIMRLNNKILDDAYFNDKNLAKDVQKRRDIYEKACELSKRYVKYCQAKLHQLFEQNRDLQQQKPEDYLLMIRYNRKLVEVFKEQLRYYKADFLLLLKASMTCVTEEGEVIPFENLDEDIQNNLSFENATDILFNLKNFYDLGWDLANIFYRARIIDHNMPVFMTKRDEKQYEDKILSRYSQITRFDDFNLFDVPLMMDAYNKSRMTEKTLYESVFPEFGFKYEDRDFDQTYSIEFADVHADEF
ncbi:MAG: hypothetical protein ACI4TI_01595 [Christensenellales bacterium]